MFREKIIFFRYWIIAIVIVGFFCVSCQRDDICPASTLTTPQVNISFFDFEERDIPKPPVNLTVRITGTNSRDSILYNRQNVSDLKVPLRTNSNFTEYDFILNAAAFDSTSVDTTGNIDRMFISYIRKEIYINRACGYKVIYLDPDAELVPVEENNINWIREINIVQDTIENEINPHILIYH